MKKCLFIITVLFVFVCCISTPETEVPFGIDYSDYTTSDSASGFIMYQNYGGPRIDLEVQRAYIGDIDSLSIYQLKYIFENTDGEISDSLELWIQKFTTDQNYHTYADSAQNIILSAVFNVDTLSLDTCAVQVMPIDSIQAFHTVLNLHTNDSTGTFNGTVDSVPLISIAPLFQ